MSYLVVGWRHRSPASSEVKVFSHNSRDPAGEVATALASDFSAVVVKLQTGDDHQEGAKRFLEEYDRAVVPETNFEVIRWNGPTAANLVGMREAGVLPSGRVFYDTCFTSIESTSIAEDLRLAILKGATQVIVEVTKREMRPCSADSTAIDSGATKSL